MGKGERHSLCWLSEKGYFIFSPFDGFDLAEGKTSGHNSVCVLHINNNSIGSSLTIIHTQPTTSLTSFHSQLIYSKE